MTDEHGMPLPSDDNPVPWRMCGLFEIMSSNETYVSELGESLGDIDAEFIVHAANWIIPCREIVRRLAEATTKEVNPAESYRRIGYEAAKLWIQMQKGAGDE